MKEQANEIKELNEKAKEEKKIIKSLEKKLKELEISHQNEISSLKSDYDEQIENPTSEKTMI